MAINQNEIPILEFDDAKDAFINAPDLHKNIGKSRCCVVTYFYEAVQKKLAEGLLTQVAAMPSSISPDVPVYEMMMDGKPVNLCLGYLGSAGAAMTLEELIALGMDKFIVCGGAGVLVPDIAVGHLVVPTAAVRDDGASYQYAPPSRAINANERAVHVIADTLRSENIPFIDGKTWTTDAIYRETRDRIALRVAEGCLTVEMEAAAYFAVSQFRGVTLGQILYGGDDLSGDVWDSRSWSNRRDVRENLIDLSARCCLRL